MNNNHKNSSSQALQHESGAIHQNSPVVGVAQNGRSEASCGCCSAPLGSDAKSSDTFFTENHESKGLESEKVLHENSVLEVIDEETGEVKRVKSHNWGKAEVLSPEQMLTEKFQLQRSAGRLMPDSRTAKCTRLTTGGDVAVFKSVEYGKSHYGGLQTCGSVWACPVCSAKVSSRRKDETMKAMKMQIEQGKQLYFVTLTFPHYKQDSLAELRKKQSEALKYYRKSYDYKKFVKETGYRGSIRALEVTFGFSNGWHPHTHEIIFCDHKATFGSIKQRLFRAWHDACVKAGLPKPSYRNGVDVRGGDKAAEYINKYGSELALSHTKKARNGRFSPYDLLRGYKHEGDKQLGAKFVEFAEAMKGARQLFWSPKLKARFGINEVSDEELAAAKEDRATEQGRIPLIKWRAVVKYFSRANVLIMAEKHGFEVTEKYIDGLFAKYISTGDFERDEQRRAAYLEKKKIYQVKSWRNMDEIRQDVQRQLNQIEIQKQNDLNRNNKIVQDTLDWYQENMSGIDNPYTAKP